MKIFCYDMTILERFRKRSGINFLIHDSTLYDGVDSRQRANALEFAHELCTKNNIQYICALNSDMIPSSDFSDTFKVDEYVCLRLSDKSSSDSLMGFSFEVKKKK